MKSNKVLYIIIILCFVLVIGFCAFLIITHKEEVLSDNEMFKRDFEQYNGLTYEDTNDKVIDVEIPIDNPFIYKSDKEIVDILKNEEAYVLFGYASCPLTRAIIETLIDVLEENNIDTVYYVDIKDIRDEYKSNGNIVAEKVKNGTDAYYEILDFFGTELERYYVPDETGMFLYDTRVTRLMSPTFVAVRNGEIVSMHEELVDTYDDSNRELTSEEKEVLKEEYEKVISMMNEEETAE